MTSTAMPTQARLGTAAKVSRPAPRRSGEGRPGWVFATPFLVLYLAFLIGPVVIGVVVSFFNTATVKSGLGNYVGTSNYSQVLQSSDFWTAMWHSTLFTLLTTPLLVLLPLLLAVLASRVKRGRWFFRLALFAPYVVPSSVVCLIFAFMYIPNTGLLSKAFTAVGLGDPNFLGSTNGAWAAVTLLTLWWTFGFNFILYTAAIQGIPRELYEAAAMDGASPTKQIRHLTVPMLRPTVSLVVVLQVLASLKVFDQIYILLAGGPNETTRPVIEYIYDTGFTSYRGGYAAAATMVYFVILVVIAGAWALVQRSRRGTVAAV
jgi:multiple sugar transport system permease protein